MTADSRDAGLRRVLAALVWLGLAIFVGYRLADFIQRLSAQEIVPVAFAEGGDDAYYYFAVARNLADGLGITIDGKHWTSGFQPLWLLPCTIAFLTHDVRAAFVVIYLVTIAVWFAGLVLFLSFVRQATRPLGPFETALLAALFLCEAQLNTLYVNGLETGLYCTLLLLLMGVFQDYFRSPPGVFDARQAIRLGVVSGLFLLTRNDGVFFCGCVGLLALFASGRPHRLREMLLTGAVAACLVAPWLAYCQWVAGVPLPQSGLATSDAVRHVSHPELTQMILNGSHIPALFSGVRPFLDAHPLVASVFAVILMLALLGIVLRPRSTFVDASSRQVLWAVAASSALLLLYYPFFSNAYQFYDRYLVPSKLLILILGAAVMLRFLSSRPGHLRVVLGACAALAILASASNVYWISRQFGLPYKGYFGKEAYDLPRSPYVAPGTRLGMLETGRLGFLYPFQITNLDGKTNVAALDALRKRTLGDYINRQDFDYVLLHDFDVYFLDGDFPAWRQHYTDAGTLGTLYVFKRKS